MGFHFLTPIFHFLSKLKPNEKLVSYSMKTHTWTQKTTFDKNPKKFLRQITISQLSFDKKYWLNFLELPFSNRHWRPETRPNILLKKFFPLSGYLASVCICPKQIPSPEAKPWAQDLREIFETWVFIFQPQYSTFSQNLNQMQNWLLIPWKIALEIEKPLMTKIQKNF